MMDQLLKDTEMPRMELQNSVNKLMLLRRKVIKKKKDYREAKRVLKAAVKLEKKIHLEVNTADSLVSLTFETQLGMLKTVVSNTRDGVRDHN